MEYICQPIRLQLVRSKKKKKNSVQYQMISEQNVNIMKIVT